MNNSFHLSKKITQKKISNFKKSEWYKYYKYRGLVLAFIPGFLFIVIFKYLPIVGLQLAFKDYSLLKGIWGSSWVGFKHFSRLFSMGSFWEVFRNTIIISFYNLLFGFPAPIILALMFNEVGNKLFKKISQTVSYLPHFVSWVILGGLLIQLFAINGPINNMIVKLGLNPILFLSDTKYFRAVIVVTHIWKTIGWGTIVYLASLSNINPNLYEAAEIDGAKRFQRIWYITIPSLAPVITIMLIMSIGKIINDNFDQIFNLYNPAVYSVGDVISTYTYRAGIKNMQYSFATAVGLFKNIISYSLVLIANTISRKINEYALW